MYLSCETNKRLLKDVFKSFSNCTLVFDHFSPLLSNPDGVCKMDDAHVKNVIEHFMQSAAGGRYIWQGYVDDGWAEECGYAVDSTETAWDILTRCNRDFSHIENYQEYSNTLQITLEQYYMKCYKNA